MTRHLRLPLFIVLLTLFGALLMHVFRITYAEAADLQTAPPAVTSDSAPEEVAEAAWWALRAGFLGPALLFAMFAVGIAARERRGWIIKRWPVLNDGRVWAVVSIITMAVGTLIPLAAANALTREAVWAALVGSVGLYLMPTGKKPASSETPAGGAT